MKFFTNLFSEEEANVIFFLIDYTKDSKELGKRIRKASLFVEPFSSYKNENLLKNIKIFDKGDIKLNSFEEIEKIVSEIRKANKLPLMFSRGHYPSFYSSKIFPNEKLLIFDAHADCKDKYIDEIISFDSEEPKEKFNGSTWLRRLLENQNREILLIGLRSFDEEEIDFLRKKKVKFLTSREVLENKEYALKIVKNFTENSKLHISLDFDVFDPSVFPAVDYPEPGGIYFYDFADIVENIEGKIVSIDACCLKPIENNLISEFLAVKSMFYLLSKI